MYIFITDITIFSSFVFGNKIKKGSFFFFLCLPYRTHDSIILLESYKILLVKLLLMLTKGPILLEFDNNIYYLMINNKLTRFQLIKNFREQTSQQKRVFILNLSYCRLEFSEFQHPPSYFSE